MNLSRPHLTAAALLALLAGAPAAFANCDMVDASTPDKILDIAKGYGSAELGADNQGDPRIWGRMEGQKYEIFFYGCKDGKQCKEIQFWSGWNEPKATLEQINDWNHSTRFGTASIDKNGNAIIELSVNLDFGVARKNLDDTFDFWRHQLTQFPKSLADK
jgi:hypothetical protein